MQLFRCYDTRFRATERKPFPYLEQDADGNSKIFPQESPALRVFAINDTSEETTLLEFGEPLPVPPDFVGYTRDWMWQFRGKLLVIATPYRLGRHFATSPQDFLPVVQHLEHLHNLGYVHGDIRAYNMVFGGKDPEATTTGSIPVLDSNFDANKGCLIDFDFGGQQGVACYPQGYVNDLPDGSRIGFEGRVIEKREDWYALGHVIFVLHAFSHPDSTDQDDAFNADEKRLKKSLMLDDDDISPAHIENLKAYLRQAEEKGYKVELNRRFKIDLEECGGLDAKQGTGRATGSPPKK